MKFLPLFFLLTIFSCGKIDYASNKLGEERSFAPVVIEGTERANLVSLCQSFQNKANILGASSSLYLSFDTAESDCNGRIQNSAAPVEVQISKTINNEYVFLRRDNGNSFLFPNVETNQSGVLAQICQNLSEVKNPYLKANGDAQWVSTTGINASECLPSVDQSCLLIETGSKSGEIYKLHTREVMKINTRSSKPLYGFFTERKLISKSFCEKDKNIAVQAVLR